MAFPFSVRRIRWVITCLLTSWTCNVSAFWIEDVVVLASMVIWNGYRWLKITNVRGTMVPSLYTIASKLSQVGAQLNIYDRGGFRGHGIYGFHQTFIPAFFLAQRLGKDGVSKTDEFSEKFQTAYDPPPPHFRKIILRISRQNCDKSAYVHMAGLLCIIWSYFP